MISIIDSGKLVNTEANPMVPRSCEMVGLSTDDKPTGLNIGNGWSFIEMDTGKIFFYNAADSEWIEFAGNGGGGQGGSNVLVVNCDVSTFTLDKTLQEIFDAPYAVILVEQEGSKQFMTITEITNDGTYSVLAYMGTDQMPFIASSADSYPVLNMN